MVTPEIIQIVKKEILDHKSWNQIRTELKFNNWSDADIESIFKTVFPDANPDLEQQLTHQDNKNQIKDEIKYTRLTILAVILALVLVGVISIYLLDKSAKSNFHDNLRTFRTYIDGWVSQYVPSDIQNKIATLVNNTNSDQTTSLLTTPKPVYPEGTVQIEKVRVK